MRVTRVPGRSLLAVVALSSVVLGAMACDKNASARGVPNASDEAQKEIEQTVQKPAAVSFVKNGSQGMVTVSLRKATQADAVAAKPKIVPIVKKHFPEATQLDVKAIN